MWYKCNVNKNKSKIGWSYEVIITNNIFLENWVSFLLAFMNPMHVKITKEFKQSYSSKSSQIILIFKLKCFFIALF